MIRDEHAAHPEANRGLGVFAGFVRPGPSFAAAPIEIRMRNNATRDKSWYEPVGLHIEPGQSVRWILESDVQIAGQPMEVGQEVAMLFGSAQRDPRRFPDPDRFDVGRGDAAHIGFGGGIHFCVGAPLARQELEVSLAGLAAAILM